jgi:hypothetical protein
MNKIIKIYFVWIAISVVGTLLSCRGKCGPFPDKYKIVGLDWSIYQAICSETPPNNKLTLHSIENDSIYYNQYAVNVRPVQKTYYSNNVKRWNLNLIQSAYACDPVRPTTDETIEKIIIQAEKDFNSKYPSGANLALLFDIFVPESYSSNNKKKYSLEEFIKTKSIIPREFTLVLNTSPSVTTDFEFLISYTQNGVENNNFFQFKTKNITIKTKND